MASQPELLQPLPAPEPILASPTPRHDQAGLPLPPVWAAPAGAVSLVPWAQMEAQGAVMAWDALAQWASEPNPFFESWYLLPALHGLDAARQVEILRFDIGGELAGLMPVVAAKRYYTRPLPHLAAWQHPNGLLGAPLVARGLERSFWRAVLHWADARGGLSLFLHLPELPLGGALAQALREELAQQGRQAAVVSRKAHVMLQSDATPEAYYEASVSAKKRKEYRRQANRLGELGALSTHVQRDAEGLAEWTQEFLELEAAGWKGEAGSALASHAATAALWRESLAGAAQRGKLHRLALRLDGRPIAMLASFLCGHGGFMFKTAFDENLAAYSPGVLLQRENLAMLAQPELSWIDSCADETHPMITHLWRERRPVGHVSIAIGGALRRAAFGALARRELGGAVFGV